jgi:hypothetical protein
MGAQHGIGVGHELLVVDRGAGEIDRDETGAGQLREIGVQPFQHGRQYPAVDHADAAVGFGDGDDAAGRHDAAVGRAGAQQDLEIEAAEAGRAAT